jgi:3-hydroxymyristoyl/3-hydroxydecanoyl-(acyl carrier protein) dehydratase
MSDQLFAGSRAKLQRASAFIVELDAVFSAYNNDDPLKATFLISADAPVIQVDWKGFSLLPGVILGDAVHNMRTALDLMASELARINDKSDKDVYFPFSSSQSSFEAAIKSRNFHKAGDEAVSLLMKFAPYRGGNNHLRAIHDLDIQDKHSSVLETEKTMNIHLEGSYNIDDLKENSLSLDGSTIQHHFPKDSPLAGLLVVETLKELVELVSGILDAFSSMVERGGMPKKAFKASQ